VRARVESAVYAAGSVGAAVARPVTRRINGTALAALDKVLNSRLAADVVDRVSSSALAERALSGALQGPLVEAVARDLVRYRVADRLLSEGLVEQTIARVLEGPELERVVAAALDSPTVERLIESTIESRMVDQAVRRLLESDDLWLMVEEIAGSPAVTEAISRQSAGFADQVADGVRARSRVADAWIEGRARRLLRRTPVQPPESETP
jgi:hypothetical protein